MNIAWNASFMTEVYYRNGVHIVYNFGQKTSLVFQHSKILFLVLRSNLIENLGRLEGLLNELKIMDSILSNVH